MPSSEDYTLVWAGLYRRLAGHTLDDDRVESPLERRAHKAGLQTWLDSFEVDPVQGDIPCLLIGRKIALLGYKEGRTRFAVSGTRLTSLLRTTAMKLRSIGIHASPRVHVLVHIEDTDC
jgi:hypothetical protein